MDDIKLTWDTDEVMDNACNLSVMTREGLFNARICFGRTESGRPFIEWDYEGQTHLLDSDSKYEEYGVEGFSRYIPNPKKSRF